MAEWLAIEPTTAEYCRTEVEYNRWKSFNAYTDADAMYQLLKMRAWDVPGATIFVLENDDECSEMDSMFWPKIRHAMATNDRPWKLILLRRSSGVPEGWLSTEPSIFITEEYLSQATDLVTHGTLESVLMMLPGQLSIPKVKQYIRNHGGDFNKAILVLRILQARKSGFDEDSFNIEEAFEATFNKDLDTILEQITNQVDLGDQPLLAGLISCIVAAVRPLSRGELQDAAGICQRSIIHLRTRKSWQMFLSSWTDTYPAYLTSLGVRFDCSIHTSETYSSAHPAPGITWENNTQSGPLLVCVYPTCVAPHSLRPRKRCLSSGGTHLGPMCAIPAPIWPATLSDTGMNMHAERPGVAKLLMMRF